MKEKWIFKGALQQFYIYFVHAVFNVVLVGGGGKAMKESKRKKKTC